MSKLLNNLSPLPFYSTKAERDLWYSFGDKYKLLTPKTHILPFQLTRPHREAEVSHSVEVGSGDFAREYEESILLNDGSLRTDVPDDYSVLEYDLYESIYDGEVSIYVAIDESVEWIQADDFSPIVFFDAQGNVVHAVTRDEYEEGSGFYLDLSGVHKMRAQGIGGQHIFFVTMQFEWTSVELVPISTLKLYDNADALVHTFSAAEISSIITLTAGTEIDTIQHKDSVISSVNTPGDYYLEMGDGTDTWYSDFFSVVSESDCLLKIQWWDEANLEYEGGEILYTNGYKNILYFDAEVGMPTYEFTDEVEERNGYQFPLKQISYKKYRFNVLAPEVVCDIMRIIRMSDHIQISRGSDSYNATSFLITPEWQPQGYLASVECEFTTDTVIKKVGVGKIISQQI